jgi:hypothetical protein
MLQMSLLLWLDKEQEFSVSRFMDGYPQREVLRVLIRRRVASRGPFETQSWPEISGITFFETITSARRIKKNMLYVIKFP